MRADLHIHTSMSDGLFAPSQVVRMAASAGLDVIAITDHNTIAGLLEAGRIAHEMDITFIAGVELTCTIAGYGEIHLLGFGFDTANSALVETFEHVRRLKRAQIHEIVENLSRQGINIRFEDVLRQAESCYVGRQHVARALRHKRNPMSRYEIFQTYIGREGKAYVKMEPFPPEEAIASIKQAGGLTVLAHPSIELLDSSVRDLVDVGLDGIEVYRPLCQGNELLYLEMVAEDLGLIATGGSDWHGLPNDPPLGTFHLDEKVVDPLLARLSI
mgnify:CR=1 FL=1